MLTRSVLVFVVLSAWSIGPSESSSASYRSECHHVSVPVARGLIVPGELAPRYKWPWLVALFVKADNKFICAGSLISNRFVLTAAHCIQSEGDKQPRDQKNVNIYLGRWNLSDATEHDAVLATPEKFIVHHDWNVGDTRWDADIAIAKLDNDVTLSWSVQPVCLWTSQMQPEAHDGGIVVGWSQTEGDGAHSEVLEEANVLRLPIEDCYEADGLSQVIPGRGLCMRGNREGACNGNDGGGLFTAQGGKWFLRGITSMSRHNAAKECDAIFTNVEKFVPWIDQVLDESENLECRFDIGVYGYVCYLRSPFTRRDRKNFQVSGSHDEGKINVDVRRFYAWYKKLKFLPITLSRIFPNLKSYVVRNSGLEEISRNNFVGLPELKELWLIENPLKEIPVDVFYDLTNLEELQLEENRIEAIDSDTFIHNTKLYRIDLEGNKITSLDSSTFRNNLKLEVINFSHNLLTSIGPELLTPLENLREVNFRNNPCVDKEWNGRNSMYSVKEEFKEICASKCQ